MRRRETIQNRTGSQTLPDGSVKPAREKLRAKDLIVKLKTRNNFKNIKWRGLGALSHASSDFVADSLVRDVDFYCVDVYVSWLMIFFVYPFRQVG